MACGAIINANNAVLPPELRDITLNCRHVYVPPFEMPDFETQVRQPDADLRDADPRVRGRDRPGDGRGRDRRLRGGRRLRHPDPPADRRGPGARRDRPRDRRRPARDVRLRRVRPAPDRELLRLPRPPRARPARDQDRPHREPVAVLVARDEGHGRGRRRRDPRDLRGDPGRAAARGHEGGRQRLATTRPSASGGCSRPRRRRRRW